jgi:hypothetical protein
MVPYRNIAGNSGVIAYAIKPDSIAVQFTDGKVYVYTYASAGKRNIEQMKKLAKNGLGLSTFISTTVKNRYEEKSGN